MVISPNSCLLTTVFDCQSAPSSERSQISSPSNTLSLLEGRNSKLKILTMGYSPMLYAMGASGSSSSYATAQSRLTVRRLAPPCTTDTNSHPQCSCYHRIFHSGNWCALYVVSLTSPDLTHIRQPFGYFSPPQYYPSRNSSSPYTSAM
jgi:hypothetical protein